MLQQKLIWLKPDEAFAVAREFLPQVKVCLMGTMLGGIAARMSLQVFGATPSFHTLTSVWSNGTPHHRGIWGNRWFPPPTEKSVVCMQWLTAVLQNPKEAYISVICFKGLAYLQQTTVVCWYTQRGRAEEERLVKLFGVVFAFKGGKKKKGSLYKICPKLSSLFPILWFPSILFIKTKPRQQRWQQQKRLVTQSKCMQTAVYLSKKKASNSIHLSRQVPNTK